MSSVLIPPIVRRILLARIYQSAPLLNCSLSLSVARHLRHVKVLVHARIDPMANLGLSAGAANAYDVKGTVIDSKVHLHILILHNLAIHCSALCAVVPREESNVTVVLCVEKSQPKAAGPARASMRSAA